MKCFRLHRLPDASSMDEFNIFIKGQVANKRQQSCLCRRKRSWVECFRLHRLHIESNSDNE